MSEENVELVRKVFDAVARRDTASVFAAYDPEIEWDVAGSPFGSLVGGVYHGYDGLRSWSRKWYEAWESVEHECRELIDAGNNVISVVTNRGRGRASGAEVELTQFAVWTIRGGKIVRVVWFLTRREALETVGLAE
jgi:ketosteroid isomerase-like protein